MRKLRVLENKEDSKKNLTIYFGKWGSWKMIGIRKNGGSYK